MKTVCIYHNRDLDGWMSAAIVKKWFSETNPIIHSDNKNQKFKSDVKPVNKYKLSRSTNLTFLGWDYGDDIPDLSDYKRIIMCDISFTDKNGSAKPMLDLHNSINQLIYIDHHKSSIDAIKKITSRKNIPFRGITKTDKAACELTWEYFFPNNEMPEIVRLLGRYDCFGYKVTREDFLRRDVLLEYSKSNTRYMSQEEQDELSELNLKLIEEQKILEFQYGARASMSNYNDCYERLRHSILDREKQVITPVESIIHENGKIIYKYLYEEAKQIYSKAFPIEFIVSDGNSPIDNIATVNHYNFLCVNQERFNPINFAIDYHKDGYDGFACFWYKDGNWHFSLYNNNGEVDCSEIANQYGGGGHEVAARFILDDDQIIKFIKDHGV